MTLTPWLFACRRQRLIRDDDQITFGKPFIKCVIKQTFTVTAETHLKLAAHMFVGFDEPILVIHHNAILVFTFGVISKSNRNLSFVLKLHFRKNKNKHRKP